MSSKFANAALSGKLTGKQALEEMLSMTKEEAVESGVDIQDIKISELHEFKDHPFHVLDNEDMDLLVSSIQENGIIVPILVRKRSLGGYEIISGHRRTTAAKKAGLVSVPAIIQELLTNLVKTSMPEIWLRKKPERVLCRCRGTYASIT